MSQANGPKFIRCPRCEELRLMQSEQLPQYSGHATNCTKCGEPLTVPAVAPTALPALGATPAAGSLPLEYGGYSQSKETAIGPGCGKQILVSVIILLCGACLIALLLPSLGKAREPAQRIKCSSNLKNIGLACMMYSNNEKDGAFPDSFVTLMTAEELTPEVFVCPSSNDVRAPGTTPSQISTAFAMGGYCSYVYAGKGLTSRSPATDVLAYEALTNHKNKGMNVLYVDCHVQWLDQPEAKKLIAQLQAGPQPASATAPTSGQ